jgi:hypothetical protein
VNELFKIAMINQSRLRDNENEMASPKEDG